MAKQRDRSFWQGLREEYERGGQTHLALAAKHGVNMHSMKGQFYKLGKQKGARRQPKAVGAVPKAAFLPVTVSPQAPERRQRVVALVADDPESLAATLRLLLQRC